MDEVSGGDIWDSVIPISFSLPGGAGGSDVTLYGIGYSGGGGGWSFGFGVSDDHQVFGANITLAF